MALAPNSARAPDDNPLSKSVRELIADLALIEDVLRAVPTVLREGHRVTINPDFTALKDAERHIVSELRRRAVTSNTLDRLA
ncbi:hypothetical protein N802_16335 [Knoellia sinensis KCTC 19936]|uniref:Uncharacterized protein n=1 Tax=Knoellia sinensis KCTC 19936 TaxID=1385520 RepID=A0A0A0J6S6_9MICO|nr:hypothetical protein [Knoellia sinensis]KGN33025.1 hypothetical protein N802_16335 [Knoellia sinensis KCTC 19936]